MTKNKRVSSFFHPLSLVEIIILSLIALGILLLWSRNFHKFFSYLYNPYSFLILFIIILEYIILKGRDRSHLYQIQIEHLTKRLEELKDKIRDVEKGIFVLEKYIDENSQSEASTFTKNLRDEFEKIKNILKK